ncbi:MAG: nucleoside kinase [Firmicutes bacterium HGW-Firmicutes-7]|nr:MAG: nucleoside kinase [Firmicutes bacterium HGW-Firmicutes-7]
MGKKVQLNKGTTLFQLSKVYQDSFASPIIIALVDYKLKELSYKLEEPCQIDFLDITDRDGYKTYQRSLQFLMVKAIRDVIGMDKYVETIIQYSINRGIYCEVKLDRPLNEELLIKIKERMNEMITAETVLERRPVKVDHAREIFEKQNMLDKIELFKYRRSSMVNLCKLEDYYDYYYGQIAPHAGYLKSFDLFLYDEGIVLQFSTRQQPNLVDEFNPDKKLFKTLKGASKWGEIMEVENVGDLNKVISTSQINDLILVSEALMEKRIAHIADQIIDNTNKKKFVFIAGPSSSGKTTFANRLAIQLRAHGVKPHTISLDNYFVSREETPKDSDGKFNFECLEALDLVQFNEDMTDLLAGKTVDMPIFNFISGEREHKGKLLTLEDNDVLVIEGIHGLNNKVSYAIPDDSKFKIYISALTQLNIDNHNRIPTTDARLIRRMVRDNYYRGASAIKTIGMWESVRRGEENYIFPFQEEADVMFNSVLIYELTVLKQFAEPLLFNVPRDCPEYTEARRLIKLLDYFLGVTSDKIPYNSLLREFIGGSCF